MKDFRYNNIPLNNKSISKDCERLFCRTYQDKIRYAVSINKGDNVISRLVGIKDTKGKTHYSTIIFN